MEENILLQAFAASLGIDNEARSRAHEYLQSIRSNPGLIPVLLKISLDETQGGDLRQTSVIYLKNLTKIWKDSARDYVIAAEDKLFLRTNIIKCLNFSLPEKIRSQFEEIAHNITKIDYPWNGILEQIEQALSQECEIYSGLNMIYQISRNFEYTMNEKRNFLLNIMSKFFDKLLRLLQVLLQSSTPDSFSYIQLILQIFWVFIYIDLPADFATKDFLNDWFICFQSILLKDYTEIQSIPQSEEEGKIREKQSQWLCKKWAAQIVHRFFTRYFNISHLQKQNIFIGQHFQENWASEFFKVIIPQLFKYKEVFIPSLLLNYFIKYTTQGLKFARTYSMLDENSIFHLLVNVILPILSRVPSDDELWRENPIEFIRKEADLGKAYYSPKSSSVDLLLTLCEKGWLIRVCEYISTQFQAPVDLLQKEALLLMFGSLAEQVKNHKDLKEHVQVILQKHVFAEFLSEIGFLRSRCAWVFARYASAPFTDQSFLQQVLEALCKTLVDSQLPVRYEGALALPKVLSWDVSKQRLASELRGLLEIYLKLMNEIDSEDVVEALESIVSAFPKEIVPFSMELTQHLTLAFTRMIQKDMNEDEGESAMAAVSTLNTISKIIDVLEEKPEDLVKVSHILKPVFDHCLSEEGCDYFEETLNLLTCLLYYAPDNSLPHLFYLITHLRNSILGFGDVKAYANEHVEEIFSSLANFIKKYPDLTLAGLNEIVAIGIALLKKSEQEALTGCKILIAILENYKGRIDVVVPGILAEVAAEFSASQSKKFKVACSQTLFVALWNSPAVTLACGQQVFVMFQFAFSNLKCFSESLARSHVIFGCGALFSMIFNLPAGMRETLPGIFKTILQLCVDPDDDSDVEGEDFDDNQKFPVVLDAQCQKIIEKLRNTPNNDDDDDFEEDDCPFPDPDDLYDSPFEVLNQNEMVKEVFTILSANFPDILEQSKTLLTDAEKKVLASIIQ